ncbi:MAG: SDR family NAD(P)-dependent oxidoreductase, partial [Eubacteriales bacterium]|nr:SDR family NAD(P)-dependent oxidoreductase [Eubacteriales bacterium]
MKKTDLPFSIDLNGRTAVVTGAGGVLCSQFARALAACGASVALLDLNLDAAQAVADEITATGGKAFAYKTNVLDKDSLEAVHQSVLKDLGTCDLLINGAG